ncbi:hypothetical protein V6Z12_D04G218800 [Gossypium hirsutum]
MTPLLMAARQGYVGTVSKILSLYPDCCEKVDNEESLEKTGDAHLVVTALIATVTFAAAITVPGGLISEKGLEQGTPLLIDEAAFKAFVVTNAIAFIFSVSALIFHLGVLDYLLAGLCNGAMVMAFSLGNYVALKPSYEFAIVSYLICPAFLLWM